MAEPLRHRQTKEAATDMFSLQPPRYIPTLPDSADLGGAASRQLSGAHRSWCRRSREGGLCRVGPGNFTPSLSQIPDVILSHHPARAIARRLPPSAEIAGSSRFDPVGPRSTTMTHPLRSMGIAPLRRYYEAVRPSPAHRYFQPHGWSRLCFFPWHRRPGSHVPYRSLVELRAAYTPDAARSVSGHPPS